MLASGVISLGIKLRIATPVQRLCASIKTSSMSSGSSSESSSDSDSDTKNIQNERKEKKKIDSIEMLNDLIDNITKPNTQKTMVNVAMPSKQIRKQRSYKSYKSSYEEKISEALENVVNIVGGDKELIRSELLDRLSLIQKGNEQSQNRYHHRDLKKLVRNMPIEGKPGQISIAQQLINKEKKREEERNEKRGKERNEKREEYMVYNNAKTNNNQMIQNERQQYQNRFNENMVLPERNYKIFKNIKESPTDLPELSVWKSLEQRELELICNLAPQNIFHEMIKWTESGKLWTFPIDNEYGMDNEYNVHFSEHVFLERHLKDWCPKRGPVRHYMELVCVGLSKNPYLSVEEKINHITWYKEYFKGKTEILKELGAIDVETTEVTNTVKEETNI